MYFSFLFFFCIWIKNGFLSGEDCLTAAEEVPSNWIRSKIKWKLMEIYCNYSAAASRCLMNEAPYDLFFFFGLCVCPIVNWANLGESSRILARSLAVPTNFEAATDAPCHRARVPESIRGAARAPKELAELWKRRTRLQVELSMKGCCCFGKEKF